MSNPKMQQRRERRMFSTSDDSAMTKQVEATHAPDGREIDVKPILQIVDEILVRFIARTVEGHEVRLTFIYVITFNVYIEFNDLR